MSKNPETKNHLEPFVEIFYQDEELHENVALHVSPKGVTVVVEIEGVKSRETFFGWPFIDSARLNVMNALPTAQGEKNDK